MLEIEGLKKAYGDIKALDGCSFTVQPGRMLGFLGPNGAGKTTAMRAIFGLLTPDAGSVSWQGKPIGPTDRLRFGYMPETRGLYPKMKAEDQLTYLGTLHGMSATQARDSANQWLARLGLAERRTDRVEKLSHGNQQRVQLAAALVHDPELLVLDEPFPGSTPLGWKQWPTFFGSARPRARQSCSRRTSSTWSRIYVKTWQSSITAASSGQGR